MIIASLLEKILLYSRASFRILEREKFINIHIHFHKEYDLLGSLNKIENLLNRVLKLEISSITIADHISMFKVVHFYKDAKKPYSGF